MSSSREKKLQLKPAGTKTIYLTLTTVNNTQTLTPKNAKAQPNEVEEKISPKTFIPLPPPLIDRRTDSTLLKLSNNLLKQPKKYRDEILQLMQIKHNKHLLCPSTALLFCEPVYEPGTATIKEREAVTITSDRPLIAPEHVCNEVKDLLRQKPYSILCTILTSAMD